MGSKLQAGCLGKRDRARLTAALDQLPPELAFLRDGIVDIARQNQDLLGSGEADLNVIGKAIEGPDGANEVLRSEAAAERLRAWIEGFEDHQAPWAGPVFFVEGVLRGAGMFGADGLPASVPPAPPAAVGLRYLVLDLPAEMKMRQKLYDGGVELKNREVDMFVIEFNEEQYHIRREGYTRTLPPDWPRPPHLREERDLDFQIGSARGIRLTTKHVESGRTTMLDYLMAIDGVKVEVSIFSRKNAGGDLDRYEAMLTSLRLKR
jgi:hypothetical protein